MNIIHHISFNSKKRHIYKYFDKLGIKMEAGTVSVFNIGENDKEWDNVRNFINFHSTDISDFQVKTEFTKKEVDGADFFAISPKWHFEYPQPEDDFEYELITYDPTMVCSKCGAKFKQIAPFSIKRSPKWGKRNIVQLNWVFDVYFISGSLKAQLENECNELNFMNVNKYKTKEYFDDIFQLDINQTVDLDMSSVTTYKLCDACKQKKYLPHTRGFFPSPVNGDFTIAYSTQYFGNVYEARHAVLINKKIYNLFNKIGVNGIYYTPCCSIDHTK